ncbi:hypothetical protein BDF21DRAFT_405670 [Thamnidium elegans]|nr:hypothetical protein BDF21DRAFT_405670 [Thamnidium elegans]
MFITSTLSTAIVTEYIITEKIRSIFFFSQLCFYIFVLIDKDFISFVDEVISMVIPKEIIHFFVTKHEHHLRIKELEDKLSDRARQLQSYVNRCEKLKYAFVKVKEEENSVQEELGLEKGRLKNSDDTVEFLSKTIDDLSVKKNSLFQEIADLKTSMSAIPATHNRDMEKMMQNHFVTITKLKKENSILKDKLSDEFVFV